MAARTAAPFLLAAVAVAALGFADGGYFPTEWGLALLAFVLAGAATAVLGAPARPDARALALVGLLAALAAWAALSALWSPGAHVPVLEAQRGLLYAAAAGAAVLLVQARAAVPAVAAGIVAGVLPLALYGLATRLFPGHVGGAYDPSSGYQLAEPVGYWNALGLLTAIGSALALGLAAHGASLVARVFGAVSLVVLVPTLYFTFSRGALVAAAAALAVQLALDPRRGRLVATGAVVGVPVLLGVLAASRRDALTAPGATLQTAQAEGADLARTLILLALVAALLAPLLEWAARRVRLPALPTRALGAVAGIAAAAAVAAALVAVGGPVALVDRGVSAFTQPLPEGGGDLERRLLSASGNGRSDYWRVAASLVRDEPLLGGGAGSFERRWLRDRPTSFHARDAHNLYLETLAELGPVGLALLLAALALPLTAVTRARHAPLAAATASGYVAFLLHSSLDWHWEVPAVTVPALLCGVALLVAAREPSEPFGRRDHRLALALAVPVAAVALVTHVGSRALAASDGAIGAGALEEGAAQARRARAWLPWSHRPHQLLGQALLAARQDAAARTSLRRALELDGEDWSVWYDLSLLAAGSEHERAFERARRLNPLGPELDEHADEHEHTHS